MKDLEIEVVEKKIEEPELVEDGVCFAGPKGETTYEGMQARKTRGERFKGRTNYRGCVPCDRCGNCTELRGFTPEGLERIIGYICIVGDIETRPDATCNVARLPKRGYKRVMYLMENAPMGFREGLTSTKLRSTEELKEAEKEERREKAEGYQGGGEGYKRIDGDEGAKGSGKVPTRLMN